MRQYPKIFIILFSFLILFALFLNYDQTLSYAKDNTSLIEVNTYGSTTNATPMFNDGLWAPGVEQSGIMRLNNNYSDRVKIHSLGLTMILEDSNGRVIQPDDVDGLYKKYAESMNLTITRGKLLVFENTIYNDSFYEMLFDEGVENFTGYSIPTSRQFNIDENGSVDLKYIVSMDGSSGNELQGLRATVEFMVNTHENPIADISDNDDDSRDSEEKEDIVDEELPESGITDIRGHWAEDCILRLIKAGIIVGYPDGTIKPDNSISRAEIAVLITRALKLEEGDKLLSAYTDSIPDWARDSIIVTTEEGIFEGYPILGARIFKANMFITREEMATVLMRGFKLNSKQDSVINFTDKNKISDWAFEFIQIGIENDIITGYPDNTFKPQENITRAEAFTMICKLLRLTSN